VTGRQEHLKEEKKKVILDYEGKRSKSVNFRQQNNKNNKNIAGHPQRKQKRIKIQIGA